MFAGFPVHHMTDNVRVRWIQGRTLLRPRDRKGTAQTQYKYNNLSSTYKCNFLGADNKQ